MHCVSALASNGILPAAQRSSYERGNSVRSKAFCEWEKKRCDYYLRGYDGSGRVVKSCYLHNINVQIVPALSYPKSALVEREPVRLWRSRTPTLVLVLFLCVVRL